MKTYVFMGLALVIACATLFSMGWMCVHGNELDGVQSGIMAIIIVLGIVAFSVFMTEGMYSERRTKA